MLNGMPARDITVESLAGLRVSTPVPPPRMTRESAAIKVLSRSVEGRQGAPRVSVRVYQPERRSGAAGGILYLHGGGFVAGGSAKLEPRHRLWVAELGCVVVSVDYRLAPETCFPGNVEDCYSALSWLFSNAADLGVDARRIGVVGDSAGGGLAASVALLARDRGEFGLAFQHLTSPMLDDRTCIAGDPHPFTGEFVFTRQNNLFCWSALLGAMPGSDAVSPYAAPARATSLVGLPPAFISIGSLDLFLEEDVEYARRLAQDGVPVELHVYPGAFHGFDLHPTAGVAVAARRNSLAALARFLAPQDRPA